VLGELNFAVMPPGSPTIPRFTFPVRFVGLTMVMVLLAVPPTKRFIMPDEQEMPKLGVMAGR
jgi:hypothetical protein